MLRSSRHAAGLLVKAEDTGRYLVGLRSSRVDQPNTWSLIAGECDAGEMPRQAAVRELMEETGYRGPIELHRLHAEQLPGLSFTSFIGGVPAEFDPVLNSETAAFRWCSDCDWPSPLHPGMAVIIELLVNSQPHASEEVFPWI